MQPVTNLSATRFAAALRTMKACQEAREWAKGMDYDTAWHTCQNPNWVFFLIDAAAPLTPIANELLACRFAREVVHLNPDPRVLACIETREAWARGEATDEQRAAAWAAAWDAGDAARAAAGDAADAARAAARDAAGAAAWAAARAAARDAAWDAAWDAGAAAGAAQCDIIRELVPQPVLI